MDLTNIIMQTLKEISDESCRGKLRKISEDFSQLTPTVIHQQIINSNSHKVLGNLISSVFNGDNDQQWISIDKKINKIVYIDIEVEQCRFSWMKNQGLLNFIEELETYPKTTFKDANIVQNYLDSILGNSKEKQRKLDKNTSFQENIYKLYQSFKLSQFELIENNYPNSQDQTYKHFKTFPSKSIEQKKKIEEEILCLDCEMVLTTIGLQLGRISVINYNLEVIFDSYVKPHNPIINYNTKFSGLTQQILSQVTTTLQDIQSHLSTFITQNTILIGHSLQNDLKVLKIIHSHIIDTSILFLIEGRKQQLKNLVYTYFKKSIQKNEHNSIEDCKCTLSLAKLHIQIFSKLNQQSIQTDQNSLLNTMQVLNKSLSIIDISQKDLQRLGKRIHQLIRNNNQNNQQSDLIIKQFRFNSEYQSWQKYYESMNEELVNFHQTVQKNTFIIYNFQIKKSYTELVLNFYYQSIKPYAIYEVKMN